MSCMYYMEYLLHNNLLATNDIQTLLQFLQTLTSHIVNGIAVVNVRFYAVDACCFVWSNGCWLYLSYILVNIIKYTSYIISFTITSEILNSNTAIKLYLILAKNSMVSASVTSRYLS